MYDMIIIGAGPAGITAGIYGARAGLKVLMLEKAFAGGQMTTTSDIENYPGFEKISGFELAMKFESHAKKAGVEIKNEQVSALTLEGREKKVTASGGEYCAKTVVLAMGCHRRGLELAAEARLAGRGISYCATCDGNFFKGQEVAVIGGGNTALEDALYLSGLCKKVYLIHRRKQFRGEQKLQDSVLKTQNIEIHYDTVVENVLGEKAVETLVLKSVNGGELETLAVTGVFVALGTIPSTALVEGKVELKEGRIVAGEDCVTSVEGVFAAGDVRLKNLYQIATAVSDGACAASSAVNYLREKN